MCIRPNLKWLLTSDLNLLRGITIFSCTIFLFLLTSCEDPGAKIAKELNTADSTMKSNVGKEVIIKNDTFVVINYSVWNNEYTLSNGAKVDASFIKNDSVVNQHKK